MDQKKRVIIINKIKLINKFLWFLLVVFGCLLLLLDNLHRRQEIVELMNFLEQLF